MLRDYNRFVDASQFGLISNKIIEFEEEYDPVNQRPLGEFGRDAVLLFELVRHQTLYESTGQTILEPKQIYDYSKGDCEDQAVLLASMLAATRFIDRIRFVEVADGPDAGHLFVEIGRKVYQTAKSKREDAELAVDSLIYAYKKLFHEFSLDFGYHIERDAGATGDTAWFPADTTRCDYVGDLRTLANNGFATKTNSGWELRNVTGIAEVRDDLIYDRGDYE